MKKLSRLAIILYAACLVVAPVIVLFFDAYELRYLGFVLGGFVLALTSIIVLRKGSWRWPSMWSIGSWVEWRLRVVAVAMALFGAGLMSVGAYEIYRALEYGLSPSVVHFHLPSSSWTRLRFIQEYDPKRRNQDFRTFTADVIDTPVAPLGYGDHVFAIEFKTGETVWGRFWQNDPAMNRRHDIYVEYDADRDLVKFKEVVNLAFTLFEGDVAIEKTSQKKPFQLSGCCL